MLIEIFPNSDWVIWWFRHSWKNKCHNQPKKENLYNINKLDFKKLIIALDHTALLWTPHNYDFNSWDLYMKIIDNAWYYYKHWSFLDNILNK